MPDAAPTTLQIDYFVPPSAAELRAVIDKLGLSQRAVAAKIGVNDRHIGRWLHEPYNPKRKQITHEQWATLLAAVQERAEPPEAVTPAPTRAVAPVPAHGFSSSELNAINAALSQGQLTRVNQGQWPCSGRDELRRRWNRWHRS